MPQVTCVLCSKKLKIHERRKVNKHLAKYLRKNFLLESFESKFICGKCSRPAYRSEQSIPIKPSCSIQTPTCENAPSSSLIRSPPSVKLSINSASKSHAYCFICKKPGPKLITVPGNLCTQIFVQYNVIITSESRCCPVHLNNNLDSFLPNVLESLKTKDHVFLNRSHIVKLLDKVRHFSQSANQRLSFDNINSYTDEDLITLTGLNKHDFLDLHSEIEKFIKNTPTRSSVTTLGIFLFKLKSGLSNKVLSTLFNITKSSIRRAVHSVLATLSEHFVPANLGFQHVTREEVIQHHTRALAQSLLAETEEQVILVLDGTYIYINKSGNFHFQRRSYSMHKGRPLVKPMVIVSTTGYYISVLGPYFSDNKNNDASILKHILLQNIEEIKDWVHQNDIFVVDRGFRDAVDLLEDIGIHAEMPAFMKKGEKQLSTEDANSSRLVTKVRWVVEAANARIKRWKFLDKILPTSQVPHIGDFVRVVCAISNKYLVPLNASRNILQDQLTAERMLDRLNHSNILNAYVNENNLDRRSVSKWSNVSDLQSLDFPALDNTMLELLTLGTYQLKLSSSYIQEYVGGDCDILLYQESDGLIRVRMQSRHISSKSYLIWIKYDSDHVIGWYCKCKSGSRTVGTCSHVAAVLWYLGGSRYLETNHGVTDWGQFLEDASDLPETVDSSDSEVENVYEE